jgi:hypothetical protein
LCLTQIRDLPLQSLGACFLGVLLAVYVGMTRCPRCGGAWTREHVGSREVDVTRHAGAARCSKCRFPEDLPEELLRG